MSTDTDHQTTTIVLTEPPHAVHKRDGRVADFDLAKIISALTRAFTAVGDTQPAMNGHRVAIGVLNELERRSLSSPSVEQIQDLVESVLMTHGHTATAKAYILYRQERTRSRELQNRLMRTFEEITYADAVSDSRRENANVDANSAMGTMLKFGSESAKRFNMLRVLKPEHAKAHSAGDIHIHDLDFLTLTMTCCQISLRDLFHDGFSTGHGVLRTPRGIASYSALACIAIQSNQNDQHGGQSVPNFDYDMADGVRLTFAAAYRRNLAKALSLLVPNITPDDVLGRVDATLAPDEEFHEDEAAALAATGPALTPELISSIQHFARDNAERETDRATYQAMEAFIHNLNTMNSRAGAQTPFSSINYGTDTSAEGRMVMRNLLLATEAGLGGGETAIFPIQVFRVKRGVNLDPTDPNYDLFQLACRVSARRLFPNFSFLDAPFNAHYYHPGRPETEVAYMGCRTRVLGNVYDPEREITHGRGNLSFTSINLPRLAIRARGDVDAFFEALDTQVSLVIDQLLERLAIQSAKRVRNFPFLMGQGIWMDSDTLGRDDEVGPVLKHGTLSMGFIGLAETLVGLIGEHHGQSEAAQRLGLRIVTRLRERMDEASATHGLNFSLLATPAEGLSGRFVRIDKEVFGNLPGITDKDYYTNSFHVPVGFGITAAHKISLEAPYHALTNAGHISYVELDGDPARNLAAFEAIVRHMHATGIGYGSINHPVDRDPVCGYSGVIEDECPGCGRTEASGGGFDRIRRITGYLVGTLDRFNDAKQAEERDRVRHGMA